MPLSSGFNHVATLTTDMDRTVSFFEAVFDAEVSFTMEKTDEHPYMKIVELGGGSALNIFEVEAGAMIGDRRQIGGRGAIDHFGIQVDSRATLDEVASRMRASGADEVGEIQELGGMWSLFFRGPDGMELEVCAPLD